MKSKKSAIVPALIAIVLFMSATVARPLLQRPTGQVVSGSTASGSNTTILVDSNGVVQTATASGTDNNDNIAQVAGQNTTTNGNGVLAVAGASSQGLIVSTAACSSTTCYTSGVMGAAISVGTSTVAPFGTTTTLIQGCHINNIQGAAITGTITDGNNIPFTGSTASGSFSIPALSSYDCQMGLIGHVFTSGLRISVSAGTASFWVEGKQ